MYNDRIYFYSQTALYLFSIAFVQYCLLVSIARGFFRCHFSKQAASKCERMAATASIQIVQFDHIMVELCSC